MMCLCGLVFGEKFNIPFGPTTITTKDGVGIVDFQTTQRGRVRNLPVTRMLTFNGTTTGTYVTQGARAVDSTNYIMTPALKVTRTAGSVSTVTNVMMKYDINPNDDLTACTDFYIRFYLYEGTSGTITDWRTINYIDVVFVDNATGTSKNSGAYRVYQYTGDPNGYPDVNLYKTSGWYDAAVNLADNLTSPGAGFTWGNIKQYDLNIGVRSTDTIDGATATPSVTIDSLRVVKNDKARIMIRLDDASAGQYAWFGYLESKGLKGNLGLCTGFIGKSGYMTVAQIRELYRAGHAFMNHQTIYHDQHNTVVAGTNYSYFTNTSAFLTNYKNAAIWMSENGFAQNSKCIMLPGGRWNHDWETTIMPYTDTVWLSHRPWTPNWLVVYSQVNTRYIGGIICDAATPSQSQILALIDSAVASKGLLPLYWHYSSDNDAKFKAVADAIADNVTAGALECLTIDEYLALK